MSTQKNEHNPDNLTPEQYGAPEFRLLCSQEPIEPGDEIWFPEQFIEGMAAHWRSSSHIGAIPIYSTIRRRITPPTETTGPVIDTKFVCRCGNRSFGMHEPMCPLGKSDTTGSGREGETPDAFEAEFQQWLEYKTDRGNPDPSPDARMVRRTPIDGLRIAWLDGKKRADAQVEALRRDGERLQWLLDIIAEHGTDGLQSFPWSILNDPANDPDEDDPDRLTPILDRAAIDSAQRQEKP